MWSQMDNLIENASNKSKLEHWVKILSLGEWHHDIGWAEVVSAKFLLGGESENFKEHE